MPAISSPLFRLAPDYRMHTRISEQGRVISVGDGIVWIQGLPSAMMDEVLYLEDGSTALVFMLEPQRVGAVLLMQASGLASGTLAHRSGRRLEIGCGDGVLGRILDPLGQPLDDEPQCESGDYRRLEAPSPAIMARNFVSQPLYTGNRVIDSLIPIGKGQRQLLIGDSNVGKSSLAIDAILRQRGEGVRCIYVAIGQTRSSVAGVAEILRREGALEYSCLMVAEANALPGCRYLAPFAGCAIAEAWMAKGLDTLIIYDDLSQHAQSYRELSLLLHRPPGREAYPGDIFYLHSRLLERSAVLSTRLGGGSMTALPIITTKQGEIASYIPTNLISVTDGQIYLDQKLFAAGVLPPIDVTRSVSRIGGKAQHPAIKMEAGRIRLDYLQFLELEAFTRFGTKLEAGVEQKLVRGRLLREIFSQDRLNPVSAEGQLCWLIAYNEQLLDAGRLQVQLAELTQRSGDCGLTLADERPLWLSKIKQWLNADEPTE